MEELKKSHAEHDAEVRRLSKEMQRMKRRARQHCGPMKIREQQRTIARVLVCMNNGEPTAALQYVSRSRKTRCLGAWTNADLGAELREWGTAADVDTLRTHLVVDERKQQMHKAIVQARRFAVDSTLEGWVEIQNVEKGINPAPGIVMQQAVAVKRRIGLDHPANHRSALRWLQRWLCRCGIQPRRNNVRERLSVDQMHRKVIHGAARTCSRKVGWFSVGCGEIAKNHDRFLVAKSGSLHRVVIKKWTGEWAQFFSSSRSSTENQELLHVF